MHPLFVRQTKSKTPISSYSWKTFYFLNFNSKHFLQGGFFSIDKVGLNSAFVHQKNIVKSCTDFKKT